MNRLVVICTFALLICWSAAGQGAGEVATNEVVRLRVTVLEVVPLKSFTGSLTPAGEPDPRFALTVRVDECIPPITNLKSGLVVTFAVHSPSLFLGGKAGKGSEHQIKISRKMAVNLVSGRQTDEDIVSRFGNRRSD
jgi:hypothetical protein